MSTWQPIETAPKDGVYLWLGKPGYVRLGYWDTEGSGEDGWRDIGGFGPLTIEPTHWAYLDAPEPLTD